VTASALRRALSELVGTGLLVGIGTGAIIAGQRANFLPLPVLTVAWFVAVLVPVLLCARTSGAHLNPAVTTALAASGRLPWREWPLYVGSQLAGGLLGSFTVLLTLGRGVQLGADVPAPGYLPYVFPVEFVGTALLIASVFLLADLGEGRGRARLLLPAAVVALVVLVAGPLTGVSLNPARSIAPALVSGVYTDLWIYLLAQPLAALAVAAVWRPGLLNRWARRLAAVAPAG
jgi:aquaporin NIP